MFLRRRSAEKSFVPRARCQFLRLELPAKLSKAQATKTIRLQLQRLEGTSAISFAWRFPADQTKAYPIWFWQGDVAAGAQCPEPLLTQSLEQDGPAVRACQHGWELTFHAGAELIKTRWLASQPDEIEWQKWVDECGAVGPEPVKKTVRSVTALKRTLPGWHFDRVTADEKWNSARWKQLAAIGTISVAAGAVLALSVKVHQEVRSLEHSLLELEKTTGDAAALQRQIDRSLNEAQKISALASGSTQIEALARIAKLKELGGPDQAVLVEWDVRGEALRMQIARPKVEYRLNEFLEALEKGAALKNIRLAPNPPAGMIVIQAQTK